jgi:hypothetical protein
VVPLFSANPCTNFCIFSRLSAVGSAMDLLLSNDDGQKC